MKKKIKVLHVIASLGNGGAERQLVEVLKYNKCHSVLLLTKAEVYKKTLDQLKIKYWEMGAKNKLQVFLKIFFFRHIIKKYRPDMIQAWMYNACLYAVLCKLFKIYKVPLIWNIRCSNMIPKYYSIYLKLVIHTCAILSKNVEKIIYNSYSGEAYHIKIGFNQKLGNVIHNGVDSKKFNSVMLNRKGLRKKYNIGKNDLVFICVARVDPMKNYDNFLKAYECLKNISNNGIKLVLAGKGTNELKLPNNCIALGMKENIELYYNMADVIIVPSAFGEGFSNVLVEGMLTKLLPVATDVGDAKKIIGKTGFILKGYSAEILENELSKIMKVEKKTIESMGRKARNRAMKLFTVSNMIKSYDRIFSQVKL